MSEMIDTSREEALFSYVIASGDMRYIEINHREIYLRPDPLGGHVVRGEIPGCGAGCHADLSQIFLEYAITCEGCKEETVARETAAIFGERLGALLANRLSAETGAEVGIERFLSAYACVLASMHAKITLQQAGDRLRYLLAECPLRAAAVDTGLSRGVVTAQEAFIALTASMLIQLAPEWKLVKPTEQDLALPLLEIEIVKQTIL